MREYSNYVNNDESIIDSLNLLADKSTSPKEYSNAFYRLGEKLSVYINIRLKQTHNAVLACSTEDADWLAKGILDNLSVLKRNLVVFWNLRTNPFENDSLTIAPIIKTYAENIENCDTLIICKSIIYTSCVVRTNLTYLINKINPKDIIISAPVIFDSAETTLKKEFDDSISSKFHFIYFAKDDNANSSGEVIPGIGGEVYKRLGLADSINKNKYIPELVKSRRL